jgi:hypothetical protein
VTLVVGVAQLLQATRMSMGSQSFLNVSEVFAAPVSASVLTWTLTLSNQVAKTFDFVATFPFGRPCGNDGPGNTCILVGGFFVSTSYTPVAGTLTVHFNDASAT